MRKLVSIICTAGVVLSMTACGSDSGTATQPAIDGGENGTKTEAAADGGKTIAAELPKFVTIGTGATGAAFYPIGVAMADILTNRLGVEASAQVTGGALENLQLVQEGTIDLGITMGNSAEDAYEGTGNYEGNPYQNVNALFGGLSKGYF